MKRLLKGQSLRIDNEERGSGKEAKWDRNIHIHKVMDSDNYNGAEIKIPLHKEGGDIKFLKVQGKQGLVERQLRNEIEKAFQDSDNRRKFAKYVFERIESYSHSFSLKDKIEHLLEGAESLAEHFGLESNIFDTSKEIIGEKIIKYTTEHRDEEGNIIYIIQDVNGENIRIGHDLEMLNDWDKVKEIFNSND